MPYDNPLDAIQKQFMPKQNQRLFDDRSDLLKDVNDTFYGGGNAPPPPTPTPTPVPKVAPQFQFPPSKPFQAPSLSSLNFPEIKSPNPDVMENLRAQYGWNT